MTYGQIFGARWKDINNAFLRNRAKSYFCLKLVHLPGVAVRVGPEPEPDLQSSLFPNSLLTL